MHALCSALSALYPGQRFVFVVALKQGKDHAAILAQLIPLAAQLLFTRFENHDQGMPVSAANPYDLAVLVPSGSNIPITVVPDVEGAMRLAVSMAHAGAALDKPADDGRGTNQPPPVVVTGSLYLLAQIYAQIERPA